MSEEPSRSLDCSQGNGPGGGAPCPLNPVIDLIVAGFDSKFPRAVLRQSLYLAVAGIDIPAPAARLELLHVVINGAMFHCVRSLPKERSQ